VKNQAGKGENHGGGKKSRTKQRKLTGAGICSGRKSQANNKIICRQPKRTREKLGLGKTEAGWTGRRKIEA
jgi:hypothetical protein